jgi:S-adenosylmethionine synthetase
MKYPQFTSESVCAGHPDKICDQISDAILDAAYEADINSRIAIETLATTNKIVLAGEITSKNSLNYDDIVRKKIRELNYIDPILNFTDKSNIEICIHQQSLDIALGVDSGGAGDQGIMFGYACNETDKFMPLPISMAHNLCRKMDELEKNNKWLRPDGKSQVTVNYIDQKPVSIEKIVLAKPINYEIAPKDYVDFFYQEVVSPVVSNFGFKIDTQKIILNGTGRWEIGGPASDTGLTGRKIVVDTYGGMGKIGGGCFSGKDVSKVDRSGAYAARFIAKNIVANKLADRCEVHLAYAIGQKEPVGRSIETFGTSKYKQKSIEDFAWKMMDLSVEGINQKLNLKIPIYQKTARYGHFGYDEYPWEKVEMK